MNRGAMKVMSKLIGLVKPLLHIMIFAVSMGIIGYLSAMFITILGGFGLLKVAGFSVSLSLKFILVGMIVCAVIRGVLRYTEQAANHYIAFKLLALIRHKIFVKLRELSPAKLEGKEKGNLISIITSDIELLEVFYAHTISPIAIAIITSFIMIFFIGSYHPLLGLIAAVAYGTVGIILPVVFSKAGREAGQKYRDEYGKMNSFFLDSIRGIKESIQLGHGGKRLEEINQKTDEIEKQQEQLKRLEGLNKAVTDSAVLIFSCIVFFAGLYMNIKANLDFESVIITTIAMLSSFGPVVALSSLSNNLHHTIACGNRVLDLLEEEPVVRDIEGKKMISFGHVEFKDVSFSYTGKEAIVDRVTLSVPENKIIGIHGKSGSGKSTLLKLLMRFWETDKGDISINQTNINEINTSELRKMEAFVTQDTYLFHDTLAKNIGIAKEGATMDEIMEAAKKASIHEFISKLPKGYDTLASELGDNLSGGEKQRIGVARAFLHDSSLILLDEPTSNLDSLNEAIILKSLKKEQKSKTVVLVSHRKSTMNIADEVFEMDSARIS